MKRTILLSALTILMLTGCNQKTTDTAISEPVESLPEEIVYTEYSPEDFREIDVNINIQDSEPSIKYTEYTFNVLADEPKLAKCKKDMVINTEIEIPENLPEKYVQEYIEEQQNSIDLSLMIQKTPSYGNVYDYSYWNDEFFFVRSYDDLCGYSHCFDICQYDFASGEVKTILSYDAEYNEPAYGLSRIRRVNGKLYCVGCCDEDSSDEGSKYKQGIYIIDTENNELKIIDIDEFNSASWTYFGLLGTCLSNKLVIYGYERIDEDNLELVTYEYDTETGKLTETFREQTDTPPCYHGDSVINSWYDDDHQLICEEKGVFHLETGLRSAELKGYVNGKVAVTVNDSVNSFLYIFDLEKNERYKYNMNGRGIVSGAYPMGDYLYLERSMGYRPLLLIPELGAAFDLNDIVSVNCTFDGKKLCGAGGFYYSDNTTQEEYREVIVGIVESES